MECRKSLRLLFKSIWSSLNPGGIVIIDAWSTSGRDRVELSPKTLECPEWQLARVSRSRYRDHWRVTQYCYTIADEDGPLRTAMFTHRLRLFTDHEVRGAMVAAGFSPHRIAYSRTIHVGVKF